MSFQIHRENNYVLIDIQSDKLDSHISPELKSHVVMLSTEGVKNIIINLELTRFCDSSGLSSILIANRLCKNQEGKLVLCNLHEGVRKLIDISKLDTVLSIGKNLEEAKTKLN